MILYHGSYLEIKSPDLEHSRKNLDFGCGFYLTPIYEQAVKWCEKFKRRGKNGIVSRYEFDESAYQELKEAALRKAQPAALFPDAESSGNLSALRRE